MKIPLKWLREYIELPPKTADLAEKLEMSGTKVEGESQKNGSDILDLEITTNRPDCLSLLGIAAEVGAVTGKKVKAPPVKDLKPNKRHRLPLAIEIQDPKACFRYYGRVFEGVQVKPAPSWLVKDLDWMDQKSINNIVDITNFVLFEMGQPLHAFDYDKVKGARIIVRRARKDERITAIDGKEYALDERILVIADAKRPIAIAGIMGGKDTEVTSATKRVILESAEFSPLLIRRASRLLKLSSDSSYRFERSVDPRRVRDASLRASELFIKLAGASAVSRLIEAGRTKQPKGVWMRLRLDRVEDLLGIPVGRDRAKSILSSLGFKTKKKSKTELKVKSLLQRKDVKLEADLAEELIRIHGFGEVPEKIPVTRHVRGRDRSEEEYLEIRRLKEALAAEGFFEAVTLSLLSRKELQNLKWNTDGVVRVKNAMSQEQEILRPTGLAGLLGVLAHNLNRKEKDLAFFEVGKRFLENAEENVLSIAVTGTPYRTWQTKIESSFYYVRGIVENVFALLGKDFPSWQKAPASLRAVRPPKAGPPPAESDLTAFSEILTCHAGEKSIGHVATVADSVLKEWDIRQPVYFAEISLDEVFRLPRRKRLFTELPKVPPVRRDIAFLVDKTRTVREIEEAMRREAGAFLVRVSLFDEFTGAAIPKDKRSLAFSLEYQKKDATFTEEEIRALHEKVGAALKTQFAAELR